MHLVLNQSLELMLIVCFGKGEREGGGGGGGGGGGVEGEGVVRGKLFFCRTFFFRSGRGVGAGGWGTG